MTHPSLEHYENEVLGYKQRVEEARNRYIDELSYLEDAEDDLRRAKDRLELNANT